jgi:DNA-binding LacI/PurR family transcriptional regulator
MRMPKYRIGERAMSLLFNLIRDPTLAPEISTLDATLVVRGST